MKTRKQLEIQDSHQICVMIWNLHQKVAIFFSFGLWNSLCHSKEFKKKAKARRKSQSNTKCTNIARRRRRREKICYKVFVKLDDLHSFHFILTSLYSISLWLTRTTIDDSKDIASLFSSSSALFSPKERRVSESICFFFFKFNYTASFSRAVHPIISSRESSSFRGVSGNFNFFFLLLLRLFLFHLWEKSAFCFLFCVLFSTLIVSHTSELCIAMEEFLLKNHHCIPSRHREHCSVLKNIFDFFLVAIWKLRITVKWSGIGAMQTS